MKRDTWFISFISLVTVGIAVVIFFDLVPPLRGPGQWHWYTRPLDDTKMLLFSLGLFILFTVIWYLIGVRLPSHPTRRQTWLARGTLLILILSVQVTIMLTYRSNPVDILFERLASDRASGYLTMAQTVEDMPAVLQDYPQWMNRITHTTHVRNRPPGILLVYWGLFQVMDELTWLAEPIGNFSRDIVNPSYWLVNPTTSELAANTILAVVTPLISALIIWPAYGIGSRHWGTHSGRSGCPYPGPISLRTGNGHCISLSSPVCFISC